jgi:hypothetical protein
MIIRMEQMETLSDYTFRKFVDRMVAHLKKEFPEQTENMGEDALRDLINKSMERAETYGVTDDIDIERYLECALLYGRDFDANPQTLWAGEILRDNDLSGFDKMNRINDYELFILKLAQP